MIGCTHTPDDSLCASTNLCTTGACTVGGCAYTALADWSACNSGDACFGGQCESSPAGATCETAYALVLDVPHTVEADAYHAYWSDSPCNKQTELTGPEAFYTFTTAANQAYTVTVAPESAKLDVGVAVWSGCGSERTCSTWTNAAGLGSAETLVLPEADHTATWLLQVVTSSSSTLRCSACAAGRSPSRSRSSVRSGVQASPRRQDQINPVRR